jgi:hypothetical protein
MEMTTLQDKLTQLILTTDALIAKMALVNGSLDTLITTLGGTVTPVTPPVNPPPINVTVVRDPRIDAYPFGDYHGPLNIQIIPATDRQFVLEKVFMTKDGVFDGAPDWAWEYATTVNGAGGATHMFMVVLHKDGTRFEGKKGVLTWGVGNAQEGTTSADGACNFFTNGEYDPRDGTTGPYGVAPYKGDVLLGGGLPFKHHVSLWGIWRAVNQ